VNLLPDAAELVKSIKRAAVEAVEAGKPVEVCFGTVESVSPIKIKVEQKMTLGAAQLVLSRNVTNYKAKITIGWETEESETIGETHNHTLSGQKEITVHNGLAKGEKVILIQQQKGQKYIVWDRVET